MQYLVFAISICYFCVQAPAVSVVLSELRAPAHLAEGGGALLGCVYDLGGAELYSVKWYKDRREFYSYAPRRRPPARLHAVPGVSVDALRSSGDAVALRALGPNSGGLYACEVTSEAPAFSTAYREKHVTMHLLPAGAPVLSGQQAAYGPGDRLAVNCTAAAARPAARLRWWLNDAPAPRRHRAGPWLRAAAARPDAAEATLQLRFTVADEHFRDGLMTIKCQATIAPLYQQEVNLTYAHAGAASPPPPVTSPPPPVTSEPWGAVDEFVRGHFPPPDFDDDDLPGQDVRDSSSAIAPIKVSVSLILLSLILIIF